MILGLYDGNWKNNKMNGFGILYYGNGNKAYEGNWQDDNFHGKGILYNDDAEQLADTFDYTNFNNLKNYWSRYEGLFMNDDKYGEGILYLTNNEKYVGQFE